MHGASCSTCHIGSGALSCHSRFGWVLPSYFVQVAGPLIWQSKSNIEKIMCVLSSGTKLWRTCKWDINRIHLSYQVWLKLVVLPISSVQSLSRVQLFAPPRTAACKASLSITSSWSLVKFLSSWWYHSTISPSVFPFSSLLKSFPVSGYFPVSPSFASGGQSIGVSDSASVLPMTIQDWFPLGLTGLISLLSKGLLRVFSSTTVQKHQFVTAQLSL